MSIFPNRELTEAALKLISWSLEDLKLPEGSPTSRGRVIRTSLGPVAPEIIRQQATLFRMVSVVESYLDALSRELLSTAIPQHFPMLEPLLEDFDSGTTATWARRIQAYARYHSIDIKKQTAWPKLEAAIDVRNSIAHGLGRLTATQAAKKRAVETRLKAIEVSIVDRELRYSSQTIDLVRSACSDFIRSVDTQVPIAGMT
ncbi:hypothetical protein KBX06_06600 [Micromonospora sp. C31]|uniref:hypothetical protein n=1 Tax=Micromonospora sp. C31 TaxID=2824876 RepID=UPI001B39B718|nr:hypothetical protein [Micromonospora sp. C31]MBQ1072833.1 hypothetical protein [Micromonospora sp. C31]